MPALFITGTDTGVGKTVVATALLAAATRSGARAFGFKIAESGCHESATGELIPLDATALARAAGHEVACPFRYRAPLAPEVAALEAGAPWLELATITAAFARGAGSADLSIAEGAGGLLVPLAPGVLVVDAAIALALPLLIVGRDGLGTINHTCLTIEAAKSRGLSIHAFVFSASGGISEERALANARAINALTGVLYGGRLRRLADTSNLDALAVAAAELPLLDTLLIPE